MKALRIWTALLLVLVMAVPAQAKEHKDNYITITFELTIYGDVPEDQEFQVLWGYTPPPNGSEAFMPPRFCGPTPGLYAHKPPCEGHGKVYRESVEVPKGRWFGYLYGRFGTSPKDRDFWLQGEFIAVRDVVIRAWYRFPETHEEFMPKMPQTGAGGMAGR